ncbi:hypothetical protein GQ457_17G004690 [Hibiscus cannabinus]
MLVATHLMVSPPLLRNLRKGLWATFGHHGDVIDAFIPTKKSKSGRKFGFVRYASKANANRAISRLNGFTLFGYRVSVSLAKFRRTSYWRKVNSDQNMRVHQKEPRQSVTNLETPVNGYNRSVSYMADGSRKQISSRKSIKVFIEEESLWKLQNCLIGFSATDSDPVRIHDRLCSWGLGEIKVKKMTGRIFLLEIEDRLLHSSLKESGWSYLKEFFIEVQPWSESFRVSERVVWVELFGIPLHCWNHQTFRRIVELWGDLLALGENALQSLGVEKMDMLISTSQLEKIDSIIEIEVGKEIFPVRISEIPSSEGRIAEIFSNEKNKNHCDF